MNRLNYNQEHKEITIHDDKFEEILPVIAKATPKTLVCDFDTLVYWALVGYNEDKSKREFTIEDLPELEGKLSEMVTGILNIVNDKFNVEKTYIFIRGENNYRKKLYNDYKSNRPEKHFLVPYLYDYLKRTFGAIEVTNFEAEDACATFGWVLKENCIIAFCDHDLLECSEVIMYNYQKNIWIFNDVKEGLWQKYMKFNIGENGDFANFTPQYGLSKFLKDFNRDMTVEEYEKQSFETYLWCWSDKTKVKNKIIRTPNIEKATKMFNLAKEILWLKDVNSEVSINKKEKIT